MSRIDMTGVRLEQRLSELEARAEQLAPAPDRAAMNLLLNDCAAEALHVRLASMRKGRRHNVLLGAAKGPDHIEARRLGMEIERLEATWSRLEALIQELRARPPVPAARD